MGANDRQVGGDHYKKHGETGEQHWDRQWRLFGPGYFIGCITKYVERYRDKNGIQDLEKAKHFLEKLIELEEKLIELEEKLIELESQAETAAPETTLRPDGDDGRSDPHSVVLKGPGITPRQEFKPS